MKPQNDILLEILETMSQKLVEAEPMLTELDSQVGDGDCGMAFKKGFSAVLEKIPEWRKKPIGEVLKQVGLTLVSSMGGTSGAIFGSGFMKMGVTAGERQTLDASGILEVIHAGFDAMVKRGEGTQVGDKTMIDALSPAIQELDQGIRDGAGWNDMLDKAARAAKAGSDSTIELVARRGRASYLGDRSKGHRDAGSMAVVVIFEAIRDYFLQ